MVLHKVNVFWLSLLPAVATAAKVSGDNPRDPSTSLSESPANCALELKNSQLFVGGQLWLPLGHACVRRDGEEVCALRAKATEEHSGVDSLGSYQEIAERIDLGNGAEWKLSHRSYPGDRSTLIFGQYFTDDLHETHVPGKNGKDSATSGVSSFFPSFQIPSRSHVSTLRHDDNLASPDLGYFEFNGMFIGEENHRIGSVYDIHNNDALQSGPIAIFSYECAVVMSPASAFMSTSSIFRNDTDAAAGLFGFGVMGSVKTIPAHHQTSMILSSHPRKGNGPDGIRQAFTSWGAKLQKIHNTKRMKDVTLDYLQYSTDNGAYYYYNTEQNQNYQETILGVKKHIDEVKLPVRSWLLDSWFYYKGKDHGVKEWTAKPDIFPDGLLKIRQETNWLLMAHNRYWSSETVYAKQNGGDFDFVMEKFALPLEEAFWDHLFDEGRHWGLDVYEQDWLNVQTENMNRTLDNVDGARTWLLQMGHAAKRHNLPIQYCMSWPRHILQSLEIDAVTQARASGDVTPNSTHSLELGITSMFSFALGVTPHKDSFWSTPGEQPFSRYAGYELASKLLSVIATYSTGPVAPSDKMEYLNVELIMKSCTQDGTLLKPDIPAVRTDATLLAEAGLAVNSAQRDEVWSTKTELSGYTWTYILAAVSPEFELSTEDLYPSASAIKGHAVWRLDAASVEILPFPGTPVPASNSTNIHVYGVAPVFENGWALLGEAMTKWTAVSGNRFSRLQVDEVGFSVIVDGAPHESVQLWLQTPEGEIVQTSCDLPRSGRAVFARDKMACHGEMEMDVTHPAGSVATE